MGERNYPWKWCTFGEGCEQDEWGGCGGFNELWDGMSYKEPGRRIIASPVPTESSPAACTQHIEKEPEKEPGHSKEPQFRTAASMLKIVDDGDERDHDQIDLMEDFEFVFYNDEERSIGPMVRCGADDALALAVEYGDQKLSFFLADGNLAQAKQEINNRRKFLKRSSEKRRRHHEAQQAGLFAWRRFVLSVLCLNVNIMIIILWTTPVVLKMLLSCSCGPQAGSCYYRVHGGTTFFKVV